MQSALLARLFAQRGIVDQSEIDFSLGNLLPPDSMKGLTEAANVVASTIVNRQKIIIVGDFDADGEMDIAVVETPHFGKTLVIYGREVSRLKSIGHAGGYSTHSMGSTVLKMAVVADLNDDGVLDIVLPNGSKDRLVAVTFRGRKFTTLWEGPKGAPIVTEVLRVDIDANGSMDILYGRKDGTVEAILQ